jgi:hypothetical protein
MNPVRDYFDRAIATYERDPPSNDFQRGHLDALRVTRAEVLQLLNTPEIEDFINGVVIEAAHQRERWGTDHDDGKSPWDWFWLIGYLAQKAASAAVNDDLVKARHHTISTAAALANWHLALTGTDNSMRPGIEPPQTEAAL